MRRCGKSSVRPVDPPLDPSREFAMIALLLSIAILIIPAVVGAIVWLL